jgi:hypothetical protein
VGLSRTEVRGTRRTRAWLDRSVGPLGPGDGSLVHYPR